MDRFAESTPLVRLQAILAALREPCSRELIFKYADIDFANLDAESANAINQTLQQWEVQQEVGQPSAYWISPEQQQEVLQRIGIEIDSVRRRIVSFGLLKYGRNAQH